MPDHKPLRHNTKRGSGGGSGPAGGRIYYQGKCSCGWVAVGFRNTSEDASVDWVGHVNAERQALRDRIQAQVDRQPHFDPRWDHVAALDFAITVTLEDLEEQEYSSDQHRWCHQRPVLLALLALLLAATVHDG